YRRKLNEHTGSLRAQHRQRGAGDVDDPEQVGLDLGAEVRGVHLLERRAVGVPGVVHDNVDAAELGDSVFERGDGRGGDGHVEPEDAGAVVVTLDERAQLLWLPRGGDDAVAVGQHGAYQLRSEATGTAGDEPNLRGVRHVVYRRRLSGFYSLAS